MVAPALSIINHSSHYQPFNQEIKNRSEKRTESYKYTRYTLETRESAPRFAALSLQWSTDRRGKKVGNSPAKENLSSMYRSFVHDVSEIRFYPVFMWVVYVENWWIKLYWHTQPHIIFTPTYFRVGGPGLLGQHSRPAETLKMKRDMVMLACATQIPCPSVRLGRKVILVELIWRTGSSH